jgi:hypothetical protein
MAIVMSTPHWEAQVQYYFFVLFCLVVLRVLSLLGRHFTLKPHLQPSSTFLIRFFTAMLKPPFAAMSFKAKPPSYKPPHDIMRSVHRAKGRMILPREADSTKPEYKDTASQKDRRANRKQPRLLRWVFIPCVVFGFM